MRLDHLLSMEQVTKNRLFFAKSKKTYSLAVLKAQVFKDKTQESNRFGDDGGGVPRVPIPNTTVKPSSADGT